MKLWKLVATKAIKLEAAKQAQRALEYHPNNPEPYLRAKISLRRGLGHWLSIRLAIDQIRKRRPVS